MNIENIEIVPGTLIGISVSARGLSSSVRVLPQGWRCVHPSWSLDAHRYRDRARLGLIVAYEHDASGHRCAFVMMASSVGWTQLAVHVRTFA